MSLSLSPEQGGSPILCTMVQGEDMVLFLRFWNDYNELQLRCECKYFRKIDALWCVL